MKIFILTLMIAILSLVKVNAQGYRHNNAQAMKKIEELEKIKIIDALGLSEQTSVRFFARRRDYKNKVEKLFGQASDLLNKMNELSQKDGDKNDPQYKKLIDEYLEISKKIVKNRNEFFASLNDILSEQQIAKLLVFERKFREEIRDALFKGRMHMK